jgi:iron complex transport system substrate-binding protein
VRVKVLAFIPGFQNEGRGFYLRKKAMTLFKNKIRSLSRVMNGSRALALMALFLIQVVSPPAPSNAEPLQRIISLSPSTTEILFAAGLGERVVGVTTFCDYPEEAKRKPKIGGMSNPSLEAIVSLRPDIVVMTKDGNPQEFVKRLHSLKIRTHVFEPFTIPELPDGIREMGAALGERERFDNLASDIEQTLAKFKRSGAGRREKVLFVVWPEPLIVAGHETAADDAISLLGGVNIAESARGRYPKYSIEEVIRQAPDIIFMGKGMTEKSSEDMKKLSGNLIDRIAGVPAVKNKKVFFVSDSLFRLGPRVIDGIKELAGHMQ